MWLFVLIFALLLLVYLYKLNKDYYIINLCKRIKTVDGSKLEDKVFIIRGKTIFGNNFDFFKMTPEGLFHFCRESYKKSNGKSYLLHFFTAAIYNITTAEDAEQLFQSSALNLKADIYEFLKPFLGEGLLISSDKIWHSRRKLLTPAFHFNVLQSFCETFKEESLKLLTNLRNYDNLEIDVNEVIAKFTLNNICETAMGVVLDNIPGSTEYRKTIRGIEEIIVERITYPLMSFKPIFYLFGNYKKFMKYVAIAHDFSSRIIETKRREFLANREKTNETKENEFRSKKRYAMLDTLLEAEAKGLIDHQGICDEVNTFMFEGFDTTSMCLIFTILNLSLNKEVQEKCREEIRKLNDINSLNIFDFNKLEYLECVLKESLRMYPLVPFIGRRCDQDTIINGLILPKTAQVYIFIYDIMRDPKHYPEPDVFKPERFLNGAANKLNPFAFVPFSAGSRNCIGQKFAILEIKVLLVTILKNFEILPVTRIEDLTFRTGFTLRTREKVFVKLRKIAQ